MQRNYKKIIDLLNEHIRKRPHSPGDPARLYSGRASPSRVCRTRQEFVSCSRIMFHLRQQSWTPMYSSINCKADAVKWIMFLRIASHAFVAHKKNLIKSKSKITTNLFMLESKHKCLGWSHTRMFVERWCIQSAVVCFVCTLDELFSKHAIQCHVLLHLVLACMWAVPALIHAGIALILARTRAGNP